MQATYPLSAPSSPIRSRRMAPIPGFRVPPKPKPPPIGELTIRELRDLYERNAKILATPAPSTSTYVPRIMAEQARIEAQLLELEGMQDIQVGLELARISEDEPMRVDVAPEQPRPIEAKLRALDKFGNTFRGEKVVQGLSFEEAAELEQRAHAADLERKQRLLEKRQKQGLGMVKDRVLTREEQEARIWAFMNYKPSESDLEDDDGDELDDEDPSTWFDDDQDDGRKDQDIIEPDVEDLSDIIRVDTSRIYYNTCYES
ncbi:hypothetical protein EDB92DRAFT_1871468 [Lactarius akahatsu]|uniref:Uncharacterized protein n=1 Tax=Lactarius akahatsu TaxID=416441 RepID=A0AAD4LHG3_9AGAM|nr:hypothetical protein EDB92DRAFT_1871468 [Lactarius akahatsu]